MRAVKKFVVIYERPVNLQKIKVKHFSNIQVIKNTIQLENTHRLQTFTSGGGGDGGNIFVSWIGVYKMDQVPLDPKCSLQMFVL